jgi:hypothetical protein
MRIDWGAWGTITASADPIRMIDASTVQCSAETLPYAGAVGKAHVAVRAGYPCPPPYKTSNGLRMPTPVCFAVCRPTIENDLDILHGRSSEVVFMQETAPPKNDCRIKTTSKECRKTTSASRNTLTKGLKRHIFMHMHMASVNRKTGMKSSRSTGVPRILKYVQ